MLISTNPFSRSSKLIKRALNNKNVTDTEALNEEDRVYECANYNEKIESKENQSNIKRKVEQTETEEDIRTDIEAIHTEHGTKKKRKAT